MLYRIEVGPRENLPDLPGNGVVAELKLLNAALPKAVRTARLYWLDAEIDAAAAATIAHDLLADPIVDQVTVNAPLSYAAGDATAVAHSIEVIRKPGVMDPVLASIDKALKDRGVAAKQIATGRKYTL